MKIAVDLHSHSGYAGGVGQIPLAKVAATMACKGIHVFGSGDCLYPPRAVELRHLLRESRPGLFSLADSDRFFLLQTEIIVSVTLPGYKNRIVGHHVVLFPDYESIEKLQRLWKNWGLKNTIGRPFLTCENRTVLEDRLHEIAGIHPMTEIFPAHIMTPDGVLGSKNMLTSMAEFYGSFESRIRIIETGLSADPAMLGQIPDLKDRTMISNSDCHSAALNRIGREYTVLEAECLDYPSLIHALREGKVDYTAEFNPAEGRYYLTGHRGDKHDSGSDVFYTGVAPEDLRCPECGKKMLPGVRQRCLMLADGKVVPATRRFRSLIPLIEVIAHALETKAVEGKQVTGIYYKIMRYFKNEIAVWDASLDTVRERLEETIPKAVVNAICSVSEGRFRFDPPGYDGKYGELRIG